MFRCYLNLINLEIISLVQTPVSAICHLSGKEGTLLSYLLKYRRDRLLMLCSSALAWEEGCDRAVVSDGKHGKGNFLRKLIFFFFCLINLIDSRLLPAQKSDHRTLPWTGVYSSLSEEISIYFKRFIAEATSFYFFIGAVSLITIYEAC